jgi:glycosyltransferase involved in cell wall biosynthesis
MRVSVIIPVYNRAKFVEKAVQSALMQSETGEVLFIDDGSTDDSLAIGHQLAAKDSRVRVFQQPNGKNYGPGAARNIGLRNAKFEYIAFLDSDDFFVENRFAKAKEIFEGNTEIEGISEAVQLFNYTNFEKNEGQLGDIIMFNERISSNDFFELFTTARKGYSSIVGLII